MRAAANTLNELCQPPGTEMEGREVRQRQWCRSIMRRWMSRIIGRTRWPAPSRFSRPVNLPKALRRWTIMNGVMREVSDDEILEHRAMVARWGFGCEPASAASVAGLHKLLRISR